MKTGLWPLRPPPQADELLSSWITRLAHGLGLRPKSLLEIVGLPGSDCAALDWTAVPDLLSFLAERTDQPVRVLAALQSPIGSNTPELLHQNGNGPTLQFCPACLAEAVPYFRRRWRLAFYRVCEIHHLALLEACTRCGSTVRFDDLVPADRGPSLCRSCGEDLCRSQRRLISAPGVTRLITIQWRLAALVI